MDSDNQSLTIKKDRLEKDILNLLTSFEMATGFSVSDIDIERIDTTNLSHRKKRFLTTSVSTVLGSGYERIKRAVTRII